MKRVAFKMKLYPGKAQEYKRRHDDLWPDLSSLLKETGVQEYSIFLDEETLTLFAVLRIEKPDSLDPLRDHPVMKKWWTYMKDLMESNADHSPVTAPLQEVFYLP